MIGEQVGSVVLKRSYYVQGRHLLPHHQPRRSLAMEGGK